MIVLSAACCQLCDDAAKAEGECEGLAGNDPVVRASQRISAEQVIPVRVCIRRFRQLPTQCIAGIVAVVGKQCTAPVAVRVADAACNGRSRAGQWHKSAPGHVYLTAVAVRLCSIVTYRRRICVPGYCYVKQDQHKGVAMVCNGPLSLSMKLPEEISTRS